MDIMLWICQKLVQGRFGVKIASEKKYDIFDTLRNIIPYDCRFDNMLGHCLAHDVKDVFKSRVQAHHLLRGQPVERRFKNLIQQ